MAEAREVLGELDQLAMLATLRLGKEAYGTTIREEIENNATRLVSIGALYASLDRLEKKGLVDAELGDPTPERGGRAKKFFSVTPKGQGALAESLRAIQRMSAGLPVLQAEGI